MVIPSTYNGRPVTSIGEYAFYRCTSLTSVTLHTTKWQISTSSYSKSFTVSDASTAATYLTSTYYYYYWQHCNR